MRRLRDLLRYDILLLGGLAAMTVIVMHGASEAPSKEAPPAQALVVATDLRASERRPVRIVYQPLVETP